MEENKKRRRDEKSLLFSLDRALCLFPLFMARKRKKWERNARSPQGAHLAGYDAGGEQVTLVGKRHEVPERGHPVGAPRPGVGRGQGRQGAQVVHHAHLGLGGRG